MKETHSRNWIITFLVFALVCIASLLILYWVIYTFFPETSLEHIPIKESFTSRFMGPIEQAPSTHIEGSEITLPRGQEILFDKAKFIYRGLDGAWLKIDVALLDLDPDYYYKHRINISEARRGIILGGRGFILVTANNSVLRLKLASTLGPQR